MGMILRTAKLANYFLMIERNIMKTKEQIEERLKQIEVELGDIKKKDYFNPNIFISILVSERSTLRWILE